MKVVSSYTRVIENLNISLDRTEIHAIIDEITAIHLVPGVHQTNMPVLIRLKRNLQDELEKK